ncbi:hypothetical protein EJ05DRAFT_515313 [Pseudovirgaria hyperparasitica]|uniref:EKC/KEOPS complex subunit GON7 n=1 Tax=Pseudovirgaria hyperparasitica TaxID=470096 RepID=A0A6A6VSK0_9PEZI|nr:uncharacterized protein EJ05DRAFT_515313 [Pseudovirgaria hyperparasitica]KAF2752849.1 hypothetical protein EJ05DRAFT_515313 [Pseudovirgaria hyperparasitica]
MPDLEAKYVHVAEASSSSSPKIFCRHLPQVSETSPTEERVAYLSALRSNTIKLQDEINTFLTNKMEHDKAVADGKGNIDDSKEEENYVQRRKEGRIDCKGGPVPAPWDITSTGRKAHKYWTRESTESPSSNHELSNAQSRRMSNFTLYEAAPHLSEETIE